MERKPLDIQQVVKLVQALLIVVLTITALIGLLACTLIVGPTRLQAILSVVSPAPAANSSAVSDVWISPDPSALPAGERGDEIRYGRELIAHTSKYLGPNGSVMPMSNGMNCQNCHLDAGTKPFGNNYSAVASTYPKFRARSGSAETIEKRVNDCFERSLNGHALADESHEMKSIVAYMKWLGANVPLATSPKGSGLAELALLDHPADPVRGELLYQQKCASCHGVNGKGSLNPAGTEWVNPPLWGNQSYNNGAGLFRLSRFAGYIKANMPMGATYDKPQLTDEEAWHLAAFVNTMPRPAKNLAQDWPDISKKPFDHPFGPFADGFDERQHKYGPFVSMKTRGRQVVR